MRDRQKYSENLKINLIFENKFNISSQQFAFLPLSWNGICLCNRLPRFKVWKLQFNFLAYTAGLLTVTVEDSLS